MNKLGMKETAKWGKTGWGKKKQSSLLHVEICGLPLKEQLCGE